MSTSPCPDVSHPLSNDSSIRRQAALNMHRICGPNRRMVKSFNLHRLTTLPNLTKKEHISSSPALVRYFATHAPSTPPCLPPQAPPTQKTMNACTMLDHAAAHPLAITPCHASDMALNVDTDAAHLASPNARSRHAGHYILSDEPLPPPAIPNPQPNGPILTVCKTIRGVMSSAAEAETGGVHEKGQDIIAIRTSSHALGHPQTAAPLKTNDSTSHSFVHQHQATSFQNLGHAMELVASRQSHAPATAHVLGKRSRQQR
jgi:hypothetical protein